jgi:hypothetical protein
VPSSSLACLSAVLFLHVFLLLLRYHPQCFFVHKFKNGHPTKSNVFQGFGQLEKADQKVDAKAQLMQQRCTFIA